MVTVTHLLDTNVLIQILRGKGHQIVQQLETKSPGTIAISSISLGELALGAHLSEKETERFRVARLIQDFVRVPFSEKEAWSYGEIRGNLHKKGTPIGQLDMLIGAVAKANDWILVTHNQKEFSRIQGLQLEDWQS